jgi:hypothetical protein
MIKNIIAPVQAWLLSQKQCVGCGIPLEKGTQKGNQVTCKCRRVYVYDSQKDRYRRAEISEVK